MTEPLYTQEQLIQVRNENYNAGVSTERERILKLLESNLPEATKVGLFFTDGLLKAIDLIRENK